MAEEIFIADKMESVPETRLDDRIERILNFLPKLASFENQGLLPLSDKGDETDAIIAGLNTIAEEIGARLEVTREKEERINRLLDILLKYTIKDFSEKIALSEKGDELDAISAGLNTVVEELQYAISSEKTNSIELEKTNALLKESEDRIQTIFSSAPDAVIVIDSQSKVIRWNKKAEELFGWSSEEIIGKVLSDYIIPEQFRASHLRGMERFFKTGTGPMLNRTIELKAVNKRGITSDVSLSISSSQRNGEHVFIGFVRDITESKRTQEQLKESEERYHSLVDEIVDYAIIRLDTTGKVVTWNKGAERIKGYSQEEIIGKHFSVFYKTQDRENGVPETALKMAEQEGRFTFSGWRVRKDGSLFWADIAVSRINDKSGQLSGFVKVTRDLTKQKIAEDELKKSQNFLSSIVENIPNMIFVKDATDLRFVSLNKAGEDLLGYSRNDLLGKNDYDFFTEEEADFFTSKDREVLTSGKLEQIMEERVSTRNKGVRVLETKKIPIFNITGEPQYLLGISNDITERKKNELELVERTAELKRSNEELEQFAYVASHDLQEPLRMVTSYLQLLENRYKNKLDEDATDFIHFAVDGATRMRSLINSLLEYSRLNRVKPFEQVDLNVVLEEILRDLKNQINDNHARIIYDKLPEIWADPVLIGQLFFNLLLNAIKFRSETSPVITITAKKSMGEFIFTVEDNGIGIAKEYYEKIFIIFQKLHSRERYPGTGIGLAVCKKIVERHGGRIWVTSEKGKGATFSFTIKENLISPVLPYKI